MPEAVGAWRSFQTRAQKVGITGMAIGLSVFVPGLLGQLIFLASVVLSVVFIGQMVSALFVFLREQRSHGGT